MNLKVAVLFVASTLSLVESCRTPKLPTRSFGGLCKEWWSESLKYTSDSKELVECIKLINTKCPGYLTLETTHETIYDEKYSLENEMWKIKVVAKRTDNPSESVVSHENKHYDLCWDNKGKSSDCGYWWRVARMKNMANKYKERCVDRVLHHCPLMLRLIPDHAEGSSAKRRAIKRVKIGLEYHDRIPVEYIDLEGNTVMFNRYEKTIYF